ncbi:MAG: ArsB/NhaD family transporter [Anaerolineae bacterium]|nr:ArsB/NhaD family transporter [Anaerolineae bacterium]
MKRIALCALAVLGLVSLFAGIWWLNGRSGGGRYGTSFFVSAGIFVFVFAAISLRWMHETSAALLGAVSVWLFHYVAGTFFPTFQILDFEESMRFVDWNVIFLILGMMIFMAMFSETGIFNWLAFRAFRLARGNAWLLGMALILLTGIVSAFLNDVTAILLLVPLSIEIAETVGIHPLAYVIPEVLASNIGGAATIIGDPPSTIVGSHLGLSFVDYMVNMVFISAICLVVLLVLTTGLYWRAFSTARQRTSPALVAQLEADARITDNRLLKKTALVGLATIVLFFVGDQFGMPPSVIALVGAAVLITWVRPDMHRMLREVDWTTLVFFIGIFVIVGALEATGVIGWIADAIAHLAGDNLTTATVLMVWIPGAASGIVANIPFTVAALPIADFLTASINGAGNLVLYWALVLGADLGGNATYLGSAPNIVAIGLLAQAGYRVSFGRFMRDGVPVTIVTLALATLWLLLHY